MNIAHQAYEEGKRAALEKYASMFAPMAGAMAKAPMLPKPGVASAAAHAIGTPAAAPAAGGGFKGMMGKVNNFLGSNTGQVVGQGLMMAGIPMIADKLFGGGGSAPQQGF
jgi:hypothetical protein